MATNDLYQSTFMPIFQKAETKIKLLVLAAFLYSESILSLRLKINGVISWVASQVPKELHDKNAYIRGLKKTSENYILLYYKKPQRTFIKTKNELLQTVPKGKEPPKIKNPQELIDFTKDSRNLWAEAKGSPNVTNYQQEIKKYIKNFAEDPATTFEPGKKPISLWQKAELDVRYDHQMKMLDDLKAQGVEYAWTSSHPNCSKRCQNWQGKLMSLTEHAKESNFKVGTLDGHNVYSLTDIMDQTDKYGYKNNIICGFNCRHRLIPYKSGTVAPTKYSAQEIEKERKIDAFMRETERNIRNLKTKESLCIKIGNMKSAKSFNRQWKALFERYKAVCERNGYAWYEYRVSI